MAESYFGLRIPYLELLGVRPERRADGVATVSLDVRPELTNSWEVAHGGVVMALLDCAMAFAARSTVPDAGGVVTIDMAVNFVRAGRGRLGAEGRVLRNGASLVFCEGEVRDADGALVAKALGTFKLRRRDRAAARSERSTS
ncbi:MAG TPA: PaaI family thioesterase [Burkholderiales bacterium]